MELQETQWLKNLPTQGPEMIMADSYANETLGGLIPLGLFQALRGITCHFPVVHHKIHTGFTGSLPWSDFALMWSCAYEQSIQWFSTILDFHKINQKMILQKSPEILCLDKRSRCHVPMHWPWHCRIPQRVATLIQMLQCITPTWKANVADHEDQGWYL